MHAYLVTGNNEEGIRNTVEELAKKLSAKILEFPLLKIEDVRNLESFVRLKVSEPTLIITRNVSEATEEALNAFLKNLEEPQDNLYYFLTAKNAKSLLPTIVSRCQLIRTANYRLPTTNNKEAEEFLKLPTAKKIVYLDRVRKREEAESFVENLLLASHELLHKKDADYRKVAGNITAESETLRALRANGNVTLQLTNMSIKLAA